MFTFMSVYPTAAVMDKGFFSTKNVNAMLSPKHHVDFIIAVPFTSKFALGLAESESRDIDTLSNTIVHGGESLRAVTKLRRWNSGHKVYTHVYFNARKANGTREDLYARVALLRKQAIEQPEKYAGNTEHTKYLIIRRPEKKGMDLP
jgi:transposase